MLNLATQTNHDLVALPENNYPEVIFDIEDTGVITPIKVRRADNYVDGADTYFVVEVTPVFVDGCIKNINTKLNDEEFYIFGQALDFLTRNKTMLSGYWINGKETTIIRLGLKKKTISA